MIVIVKHVSIEGPGIIEEFLKSRNREMKIIELEKDKNLPGSLDDIEAVIVLGGPMNVYEERKYPFLREENIFLKQVMEENIPLLGVCLGAQLIAKASGAEVKKTKHKEIGWGKITLAPEARENILFRNSEEVLDVFQWHEDTFELPKGAKLLASSDFCRNQAFCLGDNIYGLQFHIEVTPEMIKSWLNEYMDLDNDTGEIDRKECRVILMDTDRKAGNLKKTADNILSNFSRRIKKDTLKIN